MEKKECWKAKCRWRKTNLQVHFDIYKERLYIFNSDLKQSRQSFFFSDIITRNSTSTRVLLSLQPLNLSPPEMNLHPSSFQTFTTLDQQSVLLYQVQQVCCRCVHLKPTLIPRHHLIQSMTKPAGQSSTFHLLPGCLTSRVLQNVSDWLTPDLLQIVNMSLLSGVFTWAMKPAVIEPAEQSTHITDE